MSSDNGNGNGKKLWIGLGGGAGLAGAGLLSLVLNLSGTVSAQGAQIDALEKNDGRQEQVLRRIEDKLDRLIERTPGR